MLKSNSLFLAAGLLLAAFPAGAGTPPDSLPAPYVFMPRYEVIDTTRSTSRVMTLREIIERCTEGERTRFAGHDNVTYTVTSRILVLWKTRKEILDIVTLVYDESTGFRRSVTLDRLETRLKLEDGDWVPDDSRDEDEDAFELEIETSDGRNAFTSIPFFLEDQEEFEYELLERRLEGDAVVFKIAFAPRSDFKPLPSGTVYVDTRRFKIVHEEFRFETSPFPLLIAGIDRVSRHWKELPGGEWVPWKILSEVSLRGGWTGLIPERVSAAVLVENHRFDAGYDAHRFGPR